MLVARHVAKFYIATNGRNGILYKRAIVVKIP